MARKTRTEVIETIRKYCEEHGIILCLRDTIKPGDHYIGCRNIGPELLVCSNINSHGWINPVGAGYPYDIQECVKVIVPNEKAN